MKKLEAIIRPFKLEEVREALAELGVEAMTLCEVKGFGHGTVHTEVYRDSSYKVDFLPRFKVEVVLPDEQITEALHVVVRAARTGRSGDGKVFITPVEQVIRIRTAETGMAAI
jgi:nitrogen regulatory protein P-II 1